MLKKSHESSPHKDEHYLRKDRQIGDKNSFKIISINKPEKISTSGAGWKMNSSEHKKMRIIERRLAWKFKQEEGERFCF